MINYIIGIICGIVIVVAIIIYYKVIKKKKIIEGVTFCNRSILCLILYLVNKITKNSFYAITNPLTSRVHALKTVYDNINSESALFRHERIHTWQIRKLSRFKFTLLYIVYSIKYKYSGNPLEKQAYNLELKKDITYEYISQEIDRGLKELYGN